MTKPQINSKIPLLPALPKIYSRWREDDGALLAAAVAYYAALSFFPLMLLLISGLGFVMQYTTWGQDAQQQVLAAIGDYASASVRDNVARMLDQVQRDAGLGGPLGLLALIFTAAALFAHFDQAFDRIWNVKDQGPKGIVAAAKKIMFVRFRAFLMLLGIGALVLVVFAAGIVISSIKATTEDFLPYAEWVWTVVESVASVTLNACVFMLLYKLVPRAKVRWSEAFRGGLLAAVLWEVGRVILASLIIGNKYSNAYGIVGSFIAVMLWIYFASTVIFLGAEYVQVICRDCNPKSISGPED